MKRWLFLCFLIGSPLFAGPPGTSEPPVWNPFGGHLQYLGPGNGLKEGEIFYLYKDGSANAYYTFDGNQLCLYINSVLQLCYGTPASNQFLLLEDGTFLLLEDGGKIILEP